jgi:hypothetical protein
MTLVTLVNSPHIFCRHFYTQLDKNVSCTQPAGLSKGKNRSNPGVTEAALGRVVSQLTQGRRLKSIYTFSYCLTFFFFQIPHKKHHEDCKTRHSRYYRAYIWSWFPSEQTSVGKVTINVERYGNNKLLLRSKTLYFYHRAYICIAFVSHSKLPLLS